MNDDQFDSLAKEQLSLEVGGPSERVWRLVHERRRMRLPTLSEIVVAWAASAAVLLVALSASSGSRASVRQGGASVEIAAADAPTYTVAAVTRVAGPDLPR
jgi:hypothetical protein